MSRKKSSDYHPSEDEEFMNPRQLEYFRRLLENWRDELLHGSSKTRRQLSAGERSGYDPVDKASDELYHEIELHTRDREWKLIRKIDEALQRIEDGTYGYCEETGQPIGLARLEARPVATLCIEAQERREALEEGRPAQRRRPA